MASDACSLQKKLKSIIKGSMFDEFVTVTFGEQVYLLPKGLLCLHSDYFKVLLATADTTSIHCADGTKIEIFEMIRLWLYTEKLFEEPEKAKIREPPNNTRALLLCELWVVADQGAMPALKNPAVDSLIDEFVESRLILNAKLISSVYEGTFCDAQLRRLVIDLLVLTCDNIAEWTKSALEDTSIKSPHGFFADLLLARGENRRYALYSGALLRSQLFKCGYHDHYLPGEKQFPLGPPEGRSDP